jgi:hypothetical protein
LSIPFFLSAQGSRRSVPATKPGTKNNPSACSPEDPDAGGGIIVLNFAKPGR